VAETPHLTPGPASTTSSPNYVNAIELPKGNIRDSLLWCSVEARLPLIVGDSVADIINLSLKLFV
jgi:hypothetical protein